MLVFPIPDDICQVPVSLQYVKPAADRANPKMGVGMLAFSPDNCFLATRNGEFLLSGTGGDPAPRLWWVCIKEMKVTIGPLLCITRKLVALFVSIPPLCKHETTEEMQLMSLGSVSTESCQLVH